MDQQTKKLYEMKAKVIQAIGHPIRLALLDCLSKGPRCVCELAEAVEAERSNVSRHLGVLLSAGVVECEKDGLKMIYSLRVPCVMQFFSCVTAVLRQQAKESAEVLEEL